MCGIAGAFVLDSGMTSAEVLHELDRYLPKVLINTKARGKDSFGAVMYLKEGEILINKKVGVFEEEKDYHIRELFSFCRETPICILSNFRAEPTTERTKEKCDFNIQPFVTHGGCAVAHNGIIANDKEILKGNRLSHGGYTNGFDENKHGKFIDSHAFLELMMSGMTQEQLFRTIKGSFAVSMVYPSGEMVLGRNYRDLAWVIKNGILYFSSKPQYLSHIPDASGNRPTSMRPYSYIVLRQGMHLPIDTHTIGYDDGEVGSNEKGVVVCSGGLDSTTVATVACKECSEVTIMHFLYGCQAEKRETATILKITEYLQKMFPEKKIQHEFVSMYQKSMGGSTLTDQSRFDQVAKGDTGVETHNEWVPARNLVFLSMAAAYCDRYRFGRIYFGTNLEESGAFCLLNKKENLVRLWNNKTKLPSQVSVGDTLVSYNEQAKKIEKTTVIKISERETSEYYEFAVNSGRKWQKSHTVSQCVVRVKNKFMDSPKRVVKTGYEMPPKNEKDKIYSATGEHPFFVKGKGFVPLRDINIGDTIMNLTDAIQQDKGTHNNYFKDLCGDRAIMKIREAFGGIKNGVIVTSKTKIITEGEVKVYNFTCEPNHNYFLGTNGMLTHNCDNTTEFFDRMGEALQVGTTSRPIIVNPLGDLMKSDIVRLGLAIKAPLHMSWSCYHGKEEECFATYLKGDLSLTQCCGPCLMKAVGFEINGITTIDQYQNLYMEER